jgi:nucleotide-binding universal stress UspA family protein
MKPILLATDGSPTAGEATRVAIELAKRYDAPLLILTVWNISFYAYGAAPVPVLPDLDRVAEDEAEQVVARAEEAAREAGVRVRTMLKRGYPSAEICEVAHDREVQMIVLGSHGWGPLKRMIFGSVSTAVLHHAPCPVLVVPAPPHAVVSEEDPDRTAVGALT